MVGIMSEERVIRNDIIAVGLLAAIVFLVASLATYNSADPAHAASSTLNRIYQPDQLHYPASSEFTNACGRIGAWTSDMLINTLGVGAYFLVIGLIAMEIGIFRREPITAPWIKTVGWALSLIALTTLATTLLPSNLFNQLIGPGGYLGALGNGLLASQLGTTGSMIVMATMFFAGMMMWTEYLVFRAGRFVFAPAFMAAAGLMPFGLVHGFASWFNGTSDSKLRDDDIEAFDEDGEHEEDEQPRTIRFRRRDAAAQDDVEEATLDEAFDEEEEDEAEEIVASDDEDGYEDEESEEEEDEEFEEVEDIQTTLRIANSTKQPDPADEVTAEAADETTSVIPKPHFKIKAPPKEPAKPSEREIVINQLNEAVLEEDIADYELPGLGMLKRGAAVPFEKQKREALQKAAILEKTCKQFNYDVKVVEIETGPVISQYEIDLAPGLRLQKITALADDLAIAMRVPSVRIVAPIPGKNSVGVEVPNETRQIVSLRQVMEQCDKQIKDMKIPLFLGNDAVGAPMVADLAKLPHLLIAGRTGTGKSVCLNAIISSILMTRKPDEVRMLMIDPKMVELSGYGKLPHLMHPVVTDMRKAEAILAWAVDKMEERYALLARAGVRHVTTYNQLGREEVLERIQPETDEERDNIPANLPFIVIVADEMADLMMTSKKEVEQHIIRLAQKSRAVGIHLILATQKPTVDVITGLIKSNLPARIAFQVASKMDSRVVLDAQGAEKLLGMGDMLFLWPGTSTLLRGQGTYLSDEEIDSITAQVCTGEQNFVHELVNIKIKSDEDEEEGAEEPKKLQKRDELYEDAISVVVEAQRGSCSLLQRAMGIGYGRAARLIDYMAEDGYVGAYNGSKAREVMLSQAQWDNIQAGDPNPVNDEDWPDDEQAETIAPAKPTPVKKPKLKSKPKSTVKSKRGESGSKPKPELPKVNLKPKSNSQSKSKSKTTSTQRKKLLRLEPGTESHLSANVSFKPKKRTTIKPAEEPKPEIVDEVVESILEREAEEIEDDEWEDELEDDAVASAEVEDDEYEDGDEYEDVDDEYEDVDYEEEEEEEYDDEEEGDEYEDEDEYEDDDYEDVD
jgi:S-DNA-T family DNA segregation ATPase FtsK/SpoIIIE